MEEDRISSSTGRNHGQIVAAKPDLPPGYRFIPTDYELCFHLHNKIRNGPILIEEMKDVNLYKNDPKILSEMYPPLGEKEWYFFTSRNRKYPNGSRPDRTVGSGYWKATGADKSVYHDGNTVGVKKTLVFYRGRHQESVKTNWIMHEFRIVNSDQSRPSKRDANDMKLDDWVLCRIHEKGASQLKGANQAEDRQVDESTWTSNLQLMEEVIDTQFQIVDNNHEDPAAVLVNREDVAIASTSAPVTTCNLQWEEVIFDTQLQIVDKNQQEDPAAVLVNRDDATIASTSSPVVNHVDSYGNLAALLMMLDDDIETDEEYLRALIGLTDCVAPSLDDVLSAPGWPVLTNGGDLSRTVSEQQALPRQQVGQDSWPVVEDHRIIHQQAGVSFDHGSFHHQQAGVSFHHGNFHQQAPTCHDMASNPDYNQLIRRKRRC